MPKIILPPVLRLLLPRKKKLFLVPRQQFVQSIMEAVVGAVMSQLGINADELPKKTQQLIARRAQHLAESIAAVYKPPKKIITSEDGQ